MIIKNYMFLELYNQNIKPALDSINYKAYIIYKNLDKNNIILLEDKTNSQDYVGRVLLPPQSAYNNFSSLYNNGDYIVYGKQNLFKMNKSKKYDKNYKNY